MAIKGALPNLKVTQVRLSIHLTSGWLPGFYNTRRACRDDTNKGITGLDPKYMAVTKNRRDLTLYTSHVVLDEELLWPSLSGTAF